LLSCFTRSAASQPWHQPLLSFTGAKFISTADGPVENPEFTEYLKRRRIERAARADEQWKTRVYEEQQRESKLRAMTFSDLLRAQQDERIELNKRLISANATTAVRRDWEGGLQKKHQNETRIYQQLMQAKYDEEDRQRRLKIADKKQQERNLELLQMSEGQLDEFHRQQLALMRQRHAERNVPLGRRTVDLDRLAKWQNNDRDMHRHLWKQKREMEAKERNEQEQQVKEREEKEAMEREQKLRKHWGLPPDNSHMYNVRWGSSKRSRNSVAPVRQDDF
jgi:hypothetical protein